MSRLLNDKDIAILGKLAPECEEMICPGSELPFRSILPPVANHFSLDERDFGERLARLSDEELRYLIDEIRSGNESVMCIPPEYADVLAAFVAERISRDAANEVMTIYETAEECPD
jgi:hypothetical protein